jgi:hypothetical protein
VWVYNRGVVVVVCVLNNGVVVVVCVQ